MSTDDSVNDARSEKWDPLTAPVWDLSDVDEILKMIDKIKHKPK